MRVQKLVERTQKQQVKGGTGDSMEFVPFDVQENRKFRAELMRRSRVLK